MAFSQFAILWAMLTLTGCSVLIGNIKPSTEKSSSYSVQAPPEKDPDWIRVVESNAQGAPQEERSDVVYQSKSTNSIISINTTCRERDTSRENDLRGYTNLLLMGVQQISDRSERPLTVGKESGLETTLNGSLQGQSMRFQTVVFRRSLCVYDLMFLAQPQHFETKQAAFAEFVKTLRFND